MSQIDYLVAGTVFCFLSFLHLTLEFKCHECVSTCLSVDKKFQSVEGQAHLLYFIMQGEDYLYEELAYCWCEFFALFVFSDLFETLEHDCLQLVRKVWNLVSLSKHGDDRGSQFGLVSVVFLAYGNLHEGDQNHRIHSNHSLPRLPLNTLRLQYQRRKKHQNIIAHLFLIKSQ